MGVASAPLLGLEPGSQRLHRRRPDPGDLVELVDRREAAVLVAEVDDVLSGDRPDAVDRVELLDGRGAEADRAVFGIRADGGWDSIGGYTTLGLLAAVLALLVRTESALVVVARSEAGKPAVDDTVAVAAPRASGLARVRRVLGFFPFFRAFVAVEASLLALAAAIVDTFADGSPATRALVVALVPIAAITAAGHLVAIIASSRLR